MREVWGVAYENGRRVNRYAAKKIGRYKQLKRIKAKHFVADKTWRTFYNSFWRKYARRQTNRAIRQTRQNISNGGNYRRIFDYDWTIY